MERMADEKAPRATANRSTTPVSESFTDWISNGWADRDAPLPSPLPAAPYAASRRSRISALHPGALLIIPAGPAKVRSNDTDYRYRAHSAFAHLTGWGTEAVPGSVLVMEPRSGSDAGDGAEADGGDAVDDGHTAVLYFREAAGRDSDEFYANPEIGEFWTGPRPSAAHVTAALGLEARGLAELSAVLERVGAATLVVRDADRELTDLVDGRRLLAAGGDAVDDVERDGDAELARDLSELRLVKDPYEVDELRAAIAATGQGFDDVVAARAAFVGHARGERMVEGTFDRRARVEGNQVGYDTIAASGPHACILHWTRNDGAVSPGDLVLIDAGVELDSLYTADITRTLPVDGVFTDVQRRVYEAVLEAADAAFAIVRPGIRFREVHAAAMRVIAERTAEWGLLPVTAEESLAPENQYHRRWMVHGTSHHLGLDVHDCAQARRELYLDGVLEPGMVFTIEPGLYFQPDDVRVPAEYRGIGVRIEDDVIVTDDGAENLSVGIPRTVADVEAWLAR